MRISATIAMSLLALVAFVSFVGAASQASDTPSSAKVGKASVLVLPLDSLDGLDVLAVSENGGDLTKMKADVTAYRGKRAVHILNNDSAMTTGGATGGQTLVIVKGSDFRDGTVEVDLVGMPRKDAPADTRGFIGVAFRVQDHGSRFEAFYLRFTNGRADDQLRRNHSTQYVSEPDYPWARLRKESPGVYESYVDIEQNAWTRIKVVVSGTRAQLYVNGADQPCLIVNDLKLGESQGQIALWTGSDTEGYFSRLRIE